jgi:hypothetical protein
MKSFINYISQTRTKTITAFILSAVLVYFFIILLFAFFYYELGGISYSNTNAGIVTRFSDCFYFSLVTFQTIGYGDIFPISNTAKYLIYIQSLVATLYTGIFSGFLIYFFMNRPRDIFAAENCLIKFMDSSFWFSIKLGNVGEEVIGCVVALEFLAINDAGSRFILLQLNKEVPMFEVIWTIDFELNRETNSKLLNILQDIVANKEHLLLRLVFSGIDTRRGTPVIYPKYYRTENLKFGRKFSNVTAYDKQSGNKAITNWSNFNKIDEGEANLSDDFKLL